MDKPKSPTPDVATELRHDVSAEATSYLAGLFEELRQQTAKYHNLTRELLNLEARVELAERTVCLTRDHMALEIERSDSSTPQDWAVILNNFRFCGVRLVDSCKVLLEENKKMTPQEILFGLNQGMFRFRTSSPLREIHAALLRQNFAKKEDQAWVWTGTPEVQEEPIP